MLRTINPGELAHRTFITDTVSHVRRPEDGVVSVLCPIPYEAYPWLVLMWLPS